MPITHEQRAAPSMERLAQELAETIERLQTGGVFYLVLWLIAGWAGDLWRLARVDFIAFGLLFLVGAIARARVKPLPADEDAETILRRLDYVWLLLVSSAILWGCAMLRLLMVSDAESARLVAAISSFTFATAFAYNFPMRKRLALFALVWLYLPTVLAFVGTEPTLDLLLVAALYLVFVIRVIQHKHLEYMRRLDMEQELRIQRDQFERQSRRDGLTGLANRRRFSAALDDLFARAGPSGMPLSLIALDLDYFKSVNDRHGHAVGDLCLRAFARQLKGRFDSPGQVVARLGGEEFAVLLADCCAADAAALAEQFRADLACKPLVLEDGSRLDLRVSVGVAEQDCARHKHPEDLYRDADVALYRAKETGRNRVCLATVHAPVDEALATGADA